MGFLDVKCLSGSKSFLFTAVGNVLRPGVLGRAGVLGNIGGSGAAIKFSSSARLQCRHVFLRALRKSLLKCLGRFAVVLKSESWGVHLL